MFIKLSDDSLFRYEVDSNTLYDDNGQAFVVNVEGVDKKRYREKLFYLRMVLGKQCNFNCVYCMQDGQRYIPLLTPELSVKEISDEIIRVAGAREIGGISFWGGEPLVYFDKIKEFYGYLKPHFSKSDNGNLCIVTNGSLFAKPEIYEWFAETLDDWFITFSYDGPGQSLRGVDVFDQATESGKNIRKLMLSNPSRFSFSIVMSRLNPYVDEFFDVTSERLGFDCRGISYELDYTLVNTEQGLSTGIPVELLPEVLRHNYRALVAGNVKPWVSLNNHSEHFITRLNNNNWDEICHAATDGTMSLEMTGKIIACQNVSSESVDNATGESFLLANIKDLPPGAKSPIPEMRSMRARWNGICVGCPVRYFCYGGCPVINPKMITENCHYFKAKHLLNFLWAINVITNQPVKEVYQNDCLPHHEQFHYYL